LKNFFWSASFFVRPHGGFDAAEAEGFHRTLGTGGGVLRGRGGLSVFGGNYLGGADDCQPAQAPDAIAIALLTSSCLMEFPPFSMTRPARFSIAFGERSESSNSSDIRTSSGKEVGLHLVHHLAALDFNRDLTRAQFGGDLFVQQTTDGQSHHLPLTRRERFIAAPQDRCSGTLVPRFTVAFNRLMDCVEQILVAERFWEKLNGPGFHGPHAHRDITMSGDKNNRDFHRVLLAKFTLEFHSAQTGRRTSSTRHAGASGLFARRKSFADENISTRRTYRSDQAADRLAHRSVVIHNETIGRRVVRLAQLRTSRCASVFCRQNELK